MDDSPLMSLPPEIRNRIYEYTFDDSVVHLNKFSEGVGALTQVCKQIRAEARLMLFATAETRLDQAIWKWLNPVGSPSRNGELAIKLTEAFGEKALRATPGSLVLVDNISVFFNKIRSIRFDCPKSSASQTLRWGRKRFARSEIEDGPWFHGIHNAFCSAAAYTGHTEHP